MQLVGLMQSNRGATSCTDTPTHEKGNHGISSDCDLPSDQNDAIVWEPEKVADVYGVSLHCNIKSLLPFS